MGRDAERIVGEQRGLWVDCGAPMKCKRSPTAWRATDLSVVVVVVIRGMLSCGFGGILRFGRVSIKPGSRGSGVLWDASGKNSVAMAMGHAHWGPFQTHTPLNEWRLWSEQTLKSTLGHFIVCVQCLFVLRPPRVHQGQAKEMSACVCVCDQVGSIRGR